MAFKSSPAPLTIPDSPEKILRDLPRRKIPDVLLHQGEIIKSYVVQGVEKSDVALQLPTGSGKTLVGLLIAEWRRRKFNEKVLYLCTTRQLVNQVVEQSEEVYGLTVRGFTGTSNNYDPKAVNDYKNADKIAVTTYNSLFNINPFFSNPDIIIIDDAHAAENYISSLWSLKIDRIQHLNLHRAVSNVLKSVLDTNDYLKVIGHLSKGADMHWVDKIPMTSSEKINAELRSVIETHISTLDIKYSWNMIRDHLHACNIYLSTIDIQIRPLIPPTWTHKPFSSATQRIFMSATLGAGGDLERLTGRKDILKLPVPIGWDSQGIGRRFFIFPDMSLYDDEKLKLRRELIKSAGRSLIITPSNELHDEIKIDIQKYLSGFKIFDSEAIESSKKPFVESENAVAIISNRYEGIDFPGDSCRLLFIEGLPKVTNLQERFLVSRLGANVLFNERYQTRVLQAVGRCTRSLEDHSCVVITGSQLIDYLYDKKRRGYLHPELQAELDFGIEQSKETSSKDILENFNLFLQYGSAWETGGNNEILKKRESLNQVSFPAIEELQKIVKDEIKFQENLWIGDYAEALASTQKILAVIKNPELRGYRALWFYLAGSVTKLSSHEGDLSISSKAISYFKMAKDAAPSVSWLVSMSKYNIKIEETIPDNLNILKQLDGIESLLIKLGIYHTRDYDKFEKEILDGLDGGKLFENGHRKLGELLGFEAGKIESDASPDPWWTIGDICIVFEDHADANKESSLSATKARQVSTHPNWIKSNVTLPKGSKILSVLISPVTKAHSGALPHLNNVGYWNLDEFRIWAANALSVIRELRTTLSQPHDLYWRTSAIEKLKANNMDADGLHDYLSQKVAAKILAEVS